MNLIEIIKLRYSIAKITVIKIENILVIAKIALKNLHRKNLKEKTTIVKS